MKSKGIYGYLFKITVEKGQKRYMATCPGIGGVYEEGKTAEEAVENAYEAACLILETRAQRNDLIVDTNEHLKILRKPPRAIDVEGEASSKTDEYFVTITPGCHVKSNIPAKKLDIAS